MKTGWIVLVIVLIALVGGIYYFSSSSSVANPPVLRDTNNGNGGGQSNSVDISGFAFSPQTLTISSGDSVVWTNRDSAPHTVTSDSGSELDSQSLAQGQSYSHTFNIKGIYEYHCSFHGGMKAKIIVN